mgnify:CR=1 FL=1
MTDTPARNPNPLTREVMALLRTRGVDATVKALCHATASVAKAVDTGFQASVMGVHIDVSLGAPRAPVKGATADDKRDAQRYRWLRARDLNTIERGGVFAGDTRQKVVLNGEDLDLAVDAAMSCSDEPAFPANESFP